MMDVLCLILFLSVVASWFFANEYDTLFGVYGPTCVLSRRVSNCLIAVVSLVALWYGGSSAVKESVATLFGFGPIDCKALMFVLLPSLIVLVVLNFFAIKGSVVYAVFGALTALGLVSDPSFSLHWSFILSLIAAPVMAFILSGFIRYILKSVFSKVQVHMIRMSYYMRHVVIICIVLTALALGVNLGGFIFGIGGMMTVWEGAGLWAVAIVGAFMLLFMQKGRVHSEELSGFFADFSIYAVVSVGLSVSAVLLFFSFEATASSVGLVPAPLSVSALVFSAVAGAEVAQKSRLVENRNYVREGIASVAVPFCSFALSSLLLYIIGGKSADPMVDYIVISVAIMILLALAFAGYARTQRVSRDATDRLVYAQQQQIYEHSRALNDMELKVVLSENQALHNAVEQKRQEVMNVALSIVEQKEFLESLSEKVKQLANADEMEEKDRITAELSQALKQRLSYESDVDSQYFYAQAESLHEDFNAKLSENFPAMTQQEKRLATLLRLGFSSKYIATLMNITPKSVEISRYRLRQKLGLGKGDNLVNFIKSI